MTVHKTKKAVPYLLGVSALAFFTAVLVLILMADTTPTTPETRRLFGLWRLSHFAVFATALLISMGTYAFARSSDAFLGFVSSFGIILVFFGVLEGVGRTGIISWDDVLLKSGTKGDAAGWAAVPNQRTTGVTYQDIATRFGLPNDPIPYEFSTDKHGFRNSSEVAGDVILLGDSIILGAQIDKSKTVDAVLEKKSGQPVRQVALLGISIQEQHDLLLASKMDLSGRSVVQFLFEGNDLPDSNSYRNRDNNAKAQEPYVSSSFLKILWSMAAKVTDPTSGWESADYCTIAKQRYLFLWTRRSFDGNMAEVPHIQQSILDFSDAVQQAGGTYFLVFVPTKFRVLNALCEYPDLSQISDPEQHLSELPEIFSDWSGKSGIPYLDLTRPLTKAAGTGNVPWFWGDTHWSESGHESAARALANWRALFASK
ncbi:MAG: hypothetical protein WBC93_18040 [Sulfitobacter sp.]